MRYGSNMKSFNVQVGAQVFLEEGGEEIGAVRVVELDHLVVYVEGSGDFIVKGPSVVSAHDGKLLLDRTKLSPQMLEAVKRAHEDETD